jgi:oligosaccharide repeat unit polymerase
MGIWGLTFIGGLFFLVEDGHAFAPFIIALGALFYGLGALILSGIVHFKPRTELIEYQRKSFEQRFFPDRLFFAGFVLFFLASTALIIAFFSQTGVILLADHVPSARTMAPRGRGVLNRARLTLLPLSLWASYLYFRKMKNRNSLFFLSLASLVSLGTVIAGASRGGAVPFLIPGLIILGCLDHRIKIKHIVIVVLLFVVLATALQYTYPDYADLPLSQAVLQVIRRMTRSQAEGIDYILYDVVPSEGYFQGEAAWRGIQGILSTLRILPEHQDTFAAWLWQRLAGGKGDIPYTLNTTTIGDLYVDFGVPGLVIGMFIHGTLAQGLYIAALRSPKHYFSLLVNSYLQYVLIATHIGGSLFGVIANYGISMVAYVLATLVVVVFLWLPIAGKIRQRHLSEGVKCE